MMSADQQPVKRYVLLFSLLFIMSCVHAQRLDIMGDINFTGLRHTSGGTGQKNSGDITFGGGLAVFVPFKAKRFAKDDMGAGVFPTLQYTSKGASKATVIGASTADIKLHYLQLDLPLSYMASGFAIGIGPYASYALSGTKKYRTGSNTDKQKLDIGNEIKSMDYGLGIHMNIFLFRFQYNLGLANIATGANGEVKTRSFSLALDIPIVN